jgi:hypothetical protein
VLWRHKVRQPLKELVKPWELFGLKPRLLKIRKIKRKTSPPPIRRPMRFPKNGSFLVENEER